MLNLLNKWWNRKWSNWEFDRELLLYEDAWDKENQLPYRTYDVYKQISNDGLVRYKRIKI